ncbi:hypothetical protein PR048_008370 [Dryococelus australis]|uniref:Uncharacterized protein n=1 Tax=Dryococelus australis TaxID=614101 RepID=A0ABQ9HXQ2_9NEOP|nr:hypothetical protein PR048_008370 [Dryococelus australis]
MNKLNKVITAVKSAFLNTRKRKSRYLKKKKKNTGKKQAKLFPAPVLTRWNSWLNAVFYLSEYFTDVIEFFKLPELLEICNSGINYLSQLTNKQVGSLHAQAIFIKEHAQDLVQMASFLEGSKYMTYHIYPKLDMLSIATEEVELGKLLPKTRAALSELNAMEKASTENIFRKAACSARYKLTKLKTADPPKVHFQRMAKAFSPTIIEFNNEEVQRNKTTCRASDKKSEKVEVEGILYAVSAEYPEFTKCCSRLLWTPTSNVDSERLLSHYNNIVTRQQNKTEREHAELFTLLSFGCSNCH